MLVHSVYFWSPAELSAQDRAAFRAGLEKLKSVPSVTSLYIGEPAGVPVRPIIERTFSFALTIVFKDVPAHDAYQVHPTHLEFIKTCQRFWNRVQIYDSE